MLDWRGVDRHGNNRVGRLPGTDPAEFVERRWIQGWRRLTVTCRGIEVGGITPDMHPAGRGWWSESIPTND